MRKVLCSISFVNGTYCKNPLRNAITGRSEENVKAVHVIRVNRP